MFLYQITITDQDFEMEESMEEFAVLCGDLEDPDKQAKHGHHPANGTARSSTLFHIFILFCWKTMTFLTQSHCAGATLHSSSLPTSLMPPVCCCALPPSL